MEEKEYLWQKELEELRHSHKLKEIEAEGNSKTNLEKLKFDLDMQQHRIKRADIKRSIEEKRASYYG